MKTVFYMRAYDQFFYWQYYFQYYSLLGLVKSSLSEWFIDRKMAFRLNYIFHKKCSAFHRKFQSFIDKLNTQDLNCF